MNYKEILQGGAGRGENRLWGVAVPCMWTGLQARTAASSRANWPSLRRPSVDFGELARIEQLSRKQFKFSPVAE